MKTQFLNQLWLSAILLFATLCVCEAPDRTVVNGRKDKIAYRACSQWVTSFKYNVKSPSGRRAPSVALYYPPATGTLLNCYASRFGAYSAAFNRSIDRTVYYAERANFTHFDHEYYYAQYENATNYSIPVQKSWNLTTHLLSNPLEVSYNDTKALFTKLYWSAWNLDYANNLAGYMNLLFGLLLFFVGIGNFVKRLGYHRAFHNKYINWYRANVTVPSTFNGKHTEDFQIWRKFTTLIPTRIESIIVGIFIIMNIVFVSFMYQSSESKSTNLRHFADRTGLLSFGLLPLLILFAGRNNILTALTGMPYTSFMVFHKWVARFMWIHAFLHSVGWTVIGIQRKRLVSYSHDSYWQWGIAATCAGGVLLFQAFRIFRNMSYEIFLTAHIVLAVAFIVACFYHCYSLGWLEWVYASCALWFADRLLRVIRMTLFGFPQAEIVMVGQDTFKVTVENSRWFKPFPGAFAYLYFITPKLFLQSHPFTIIQSIKNQNQTLIFIKTKAGITKRIQSQIKTCQDGKLRIRVCLEGPYGHKAPLEKYDTALILAGGNGIPGPLSYAIDLGHRDSAHKQHIKFVWVIRSLEYLSWFKEELESLAVTPVDIQIYVTGGLPSANEKSVMFETDSASSNSKTEEGSVTGQESLGVASNEQSLYTEFSNFIQFHSGRPNIDQMIEIEFTTENKGTVGVLTCGAPVMVDNIRASVAGHLQKCPNRVDLFEELQVW